MAALPILETVVSLITAALAAGGLPALLGLMAVESFGIPPLPSEIILPFAGYLVAQGLMSFTGAFLAALVGGVAGSYAGYLVGRFGRHYVVGTGRLKLDPRHLASVESYFARRGEATVLVGRLLPVVRSYISYPAGTARMEPVRFGVYTAIGATPFTVALLYAGLLLGANWGRIVPLFQVADYAAVVVLVVAVLWLVLRWHGVLGPGFPPRRRPKTPAAASEPTPKP